MEVSPEQLQALFRKLLQGTATEEEKKQLENYLQQNTADIDPGQLLPYADWETTAEGPLPAGMKDRIMNRILPVSAATPTMPSTTGRQARVSRLRWWYSAAAALLILLAGRWFMEQRADRVHPWITVVAAKGQLKTILLPDSSKVYLNAGSELRYPMTFTGHDRPVQLRGEAFFEVKRNTASPFIVQSAAVRTTVLGTTFNIRAYEADSTIAVTVASGKVKVATAGQAGRPEQAVIVKPGAQAVYASPSGSLRMAPADASAIAGWKDRRLTFTEASLEDIFNTLSRYHNVTFKTNTPAILACKYAVTFDQLTLDESLNKLTLLGEIDFVKQGQNILVNGKPCQ